MENKNNTFSFNRLFLLGKRQVVGNFSGLLIAFAAIAGSLLVIALLTGYSSPTSLLNIGPLFYVVLFIGGFVFTSNIFAELHSPQKSIPFLTLPVSKLERLVNAWLLTAILFPILAFIAFSLVLLLAYLILGIPIPAGAFAMLWSAKALKIVILYFITQSIFLFGAVYFRKHNFLKTLLSLFVIQNVIGLFAALVGYLLFGTFQFDGNEFVSNSSFTPGMERFFTVTIVEIAKFAFYYLTVPFFLILTWFGIKERQV
ncbi:MAG: hypothetical protein V2I46_05485 [Bacteroides sp.]|jgi:hypothetical protein|nr:hypothetical protein [Bacteroides sp.]